MLGIHFFNPAPVLQLVELVPCARSPPSETPSSARAGLRHRTALGKHAIRAQDRSGFVVNALLIPYLLSAIRMFESGIAIEARTSTRGWSMGCAHPMGPLQLAGSDRARHRWRSPSRCATEFREPAYVAPPLLQRMVEAGRLGRKSERGFYDYSS